MTAPNNLNNTENFTIDTKTTVCFDKNNDRTNKVKGVMFSDWEEVKYLAGQLVLKVQPKKLLGIPMPIKELPLFFTGLGLPCLIQFFIELSSKEIDKGKVQINIICSLLFLLFGFILYIIRNKSENDISNEVKNLERRVQFIEEYTNTNQINRL